MSIQLNFFKHSNLSFCSKGNLSTAPCEKALQVKHTIDEQFRIQSAAENQLNKSKSAFQKFTNYGLTKSIVFAAGAIFNGFTGGSPFAGALFFLVPSVLIDLGGQKTITNTNDIIALKPIATRLISKATAIFATYASLTYIDQDVSNWSLAASVLGVGLPALTSLAVSAVFKKALEEAHQELHLKTYISMIESNFKAAGLDPEALFDTIDETPELREAWEAKLEEFGKNNDLRIEEKVKQFPVLLKQFIKQHNLEKHEKSNLKSSAKIMISQWLKKLEQIFRHTQPNTLN